MTRLITSRSRSSIIRLINVKLEVKDMVLVLVHRWTLVMVDWWWLTGFLLVLIDIQIIFHIIIIKNPGLITHFTFPLPNRVIPLEIGFIHQQLLCLLLLSFLLFEGTIPKNVLLGQLKMKADR